MSAARDAQLHALEDRLGHRFVDLSLLDRALTHSSLANEAAAAEGRHNEALEFLGDSVIGFVMADLLHRRDPDGREGGKSKMRAQLVSNDVNRDKPPAMSLVSHSLSFLLHLTRIMYCNFVFSR